MKYPELSIPEPYDKNKDLSDFVKRNARFGVYFDNARGGAWKPYGLLWKYYKTEVTISSETEQLLKENELLWSRVYKIPEMDAELKRYYILMLCKTITLIVTLTMASSYLLRAT